MRQYYLFVILLGLVSMLSGQNNNALWVSAASATISKNDFSKTKTAQQEIVLFNLNTDLLNSQLSKTPKRGASQKNSGVIISFPNDEGGLEQFQILEASVFDEVLQEKFPNIKSYIGKGLHKSGSRIRFSISPYGLNAMLYKPDGKTISIAPYNLTSNTYSVSREDLKSFEAVQCELDAINSNLNSFSKTEVANFKNATDGILRTFRLAISTTSEYSWFILDYYGIDSSADEYVKKSTVLSHISSIVTFLNEVYERDIGVTFQLVANNDLIIFLDTEIDGLPHGEKFAVRDANQVVQDNIIGSNNYDIGHVIDYGGGGGVATIATVCVAGEKAKGASEIYSVYPRNSTIVHEMGHQLGANHTMNKCGLNMVQTATTVEPGSGTTIMSYGGTGSCGSAQINIIDDYFHVVNIQEIWGNIFSGNSTCAIQTPTSNVAPAINTLLNYTLPISTHFALTADAIDANNDNLTYTWEQIDPELTMAPPEATSTVGPSFRSLPPTASSTRHFPNLETIHAGDISNTWEVMPSVSRTMNFAVTVRDNNIEVGQTVSATTTLTFDDSSGPFLITYPLTSEIWTIGDSKTITWDVANTNNAPVSCSLVNILLSTDGGLTYSIELASNTPNDGSEIIIVPNTSIIHGRIKIESVGNIFFDVSPEIEISIDGNPNTTAIPDPNFELALRNLGFDSDGIENGKVFTRDIEAIESLNINNKSISNLTGIEDFEDLKILNCSQNSLGTLNTNSNLSLEELNCNYNSINVLDITQNIALKQLRCNVNQLDNIDVTSNINLTHLSCSYNSLSNIDVSENLFLNLLSCDNNQLEDIDVSLNSSLINFDCNNNQLTSLNAKNGNNSSLASFNASSNPDLYCIEVDNAVDANAGVGIYASWLKDTDTWYSESCATTTYIPDANFEQYLIDNLIDSDGVINKNVFTSDISNITSLTIGNLGIADLSGIEGFTNLITLGAENNLLTSVDVSSNVLLQSISFENNMLSVIDISNNTNLTEVNLNSNQLIEVDFTNNLNLQVLLLLNNNLESLNLSLNDQIYIFDCSNNTLVDLNLKNGANTSMIIFDARLNPDLYCIEVDNAVWSTSNWENIDAQTNFNENCNSNSTFIPDDNFEQELIDLGYDDVLDNSVLTSNISNITFINISNKNINDLTGIEGFVNLITLIADNNLLTSVDVSSNLLLQSISFQNNMLSVIDISNNTVLTEVNLSSNQLIEVDFTENLNLQILLLGNNNLESLNLSLNDQIYIFDCNNNSLTDLNLKNGANTSMIIFDARLNPDLNCIEVDNTVWSTSNWENIDAQTSFNENCSQLVLDCKVLLQGAMLNPNTGEESLMRDDLRVLGYIPTVSPYADILTCDASVFTATGPDAIVDWVWVELRDAIDDTAVIESRSALLQRDGDVVDVDGVSALSFSSPAANYYLMIAHRNHIGILSANTISLSGTITAIYFSADSALVKGGTNGIADMGDGSFALFSGDFSGDGQIQNSDKIAVESQRGLSGYNNADIDMNNEVQNTDLNIALNPNIGRGEQLAKRSLSLFAKRRDKTKK